MFIVQPSLAWRLAVLDAYQRRHEFLVPPCQRVACGGRKPTNFGRRRPHGLPIGLPTSWVDIAFRGVGRR